jgi:hypothetical protein
LRILPTGIPSFYVKENKKSFRLSPTGRLIETTVMRDIRISRTFSFPGDLPGAEAALVTHRFKMIVRAGDPSVINFPGPNSVPI